MTNMHDCIVRYATEIISDYDCVLFLFGVRLVNQLLDISQLMTMTQMCPVTAIAWSPTRSGLLATLGKESPVVQLYDIQHASVGKCYSQVDVLNVTQIMLNFC